MKKVLVVMIVPALVLVTLAASAQTSATPSTRDGSSSDQSQPGRGA